MAEVQYLRKARGYVKAKLTRLQTALASEDNDSIDKVQAETRLEKLEEIHRDFEAIQRRLLEKAGEFSEDDTNEEQAFEERYFEMKSFLKRCIGQPSKESADSSNVNVIAQLLQQQTELMQHIGRGAQSDVSGTMSPASESEAFAAILAKQTEILDRVVTTGSTNVDNRVKLPIIKLPRFDGKPEEWKYFADSFRSIIHDKPHLSNIEKFQYLTSAISGDAAKIIESITLTSENYQSAWELLQQRYDDPGSLKKGHIQCLFSMPTVVNESSKALQRLIDYTCRHLRMLKVLGSPTDSWDELIIHMIESKLDAKTFRAWDEEAKPDEGAKLTDMFDFLKRKCKLLERVESRSIDKGEKSNKEGELRSKGASVTNSKSHSNTKGTVSQKNASLTTSLSSALPVNDRIKEVKQLKLCINCLKNDHYVKTCRTSSCRECAGRHNTLCHQSQNDRKSAKTENSTTSDESKSDQSTSNVTTHHIASEIKGRRVVMATAIVEAIRCKGSGTPIRVLLDSASEANFITQSAHNKLGLKRERISETVTGLNEIENKVHSVSNVRIKSKCSDFEVNVQCFVIPKITKNLPSTRIDRSNLSVPSNITLADSEFHKVGPIDMLLGAEFFFDLLEIGKIGLGENQLILQNSKLGWIVAGVIPVNLENSISKQTTLTTLTCSFKSSDTLNESLEKFWKLENCDKNQVQTLSSEERKCEQHFDQNTTRARDGKFVVKLPFRDETLPIGDNREIAVKRLNHLERKFKGNIVFRNRYLNFMREYEELGHMSIANNSADTFKTIVYLPHHGVSRESSSSTKLRVVFDASAKNKKGVSLNDALHVGPTLQNNLIDVIVRFRCNKIALTADLQKMYRQILVHSSDRDFQRILWRFTSDDPIREYQLNTVTYGQACAPYLAIRCLRQLAIESGERYPLAATALLNDTYVDDILTGANTVEDAHNLQAQLTNLLREGGFEAHKWCSNSPDALTDIPAKLREANWDIDASVNDTIKTLGIEWSPVTDDFKFNVQIIPYACTKRKILAAISKLFDSLGLIGPVLTTAKILMQELWKFKVDWDEPLPETFLNRWKSFQESLNEATTLRIPRLVVSSLGNIRLSIHGFCDASENAYGACIYVRSVRNASSEIIVKLLCSKARVAPLKKQSIPRLELCSALLLANLVDNVRHAIRVKIDSIHAWSDSMVVLHWLHGDVSRWKPFVSNHVTEIIETLPANLWKHVKGSENPADLISRGTTPAQLKDNFLWWNGPKWLSEVHHSTMVEEFNQLTEDEFLNVRSETRKESQVCNLNVQSSSSRKIIEILVTNCSTLSKIERSIAYCFRFISNCRKKKEDRILTRLTLSELISARQEVIKYSQLLYFQNELRDLQNNRNLSPTSRLYQLQAFLDENGLLRVGGRLQEAPWNFERRHPIVLPAQCKITRLIIEREHRNLLHASQQLLLSSVRQQYWPLNARNLVRQVCRSCVWCVRNNPKGLTQAMGSLPGDRITPSKPFTITGIDFAGPIITLVNKERGRKTCKSYIALFICFSTRAIHLEATSELTTAAFLAALRRFVGRRGLPRKICSDNATNFVGAKRELEELYSFVRNSINGEVGDALQEIGIEWNFIPPYSPHLGGLWEAGVKSCKYHLKRVMGNNLFTFEELTTSLVQIEACLNSRPLSPVSSDPSDLQPLTPGHFLIGGPLTSLPENNLEDVNINRLDRWEKIQRCVQEFWRRWAAEYVSNLQNRVKWKARQENLRVNDLVLLKEDNLPPLKWKTGRVVDLHGGKDNLVRVVTVRTANGTVRRAIAKLCKLPISDTIIPED